MIEDQKVIDKFDDCRNNDNNDQGIDSCPNSGRTSLKKTMRTHIERQSDDVRHRYRNAIDRQIAFVESYEYSVFDCVHFNSNEQTVLKDNSSN
jgi:hypothetical protein